MSMAAELKQLELDKTHVTGTIDRIVFRNTENDYCVLSIRPQDAISDLTPSVTVVGYIPEPRDGDEYRFSGEWKRHRKFGEQFHIQEYELLLPTTQQGVIRYLESVAYGVGPVTARKIVEALGEDCLSKIKADPGSLRELPFLKPEQAQEIIDDLTANGVQAELSALICREGITPKFAAKIYQKYKTDSIRVVKENPYVLADDIWGVGFKLADKVAGAVGIAPDSPFRVKAAVEYLLREAGGEGHCYLRPRDIVAKAKDLLGMDVGTELIAGAVDELIEASKVIRQGNAVYSWGLHEAECMLADRVKSFLEQLPQQVVGLDELVDWAEKDAKVEYAPEQQAAIKQALVSPLSIMTGGPGTGKTLTINAICNIYRRLHVVHPIYLASPTGRAAQRMAEATGREAKTLHRLLAYSPFTNRFEHNSDNPLGGPGLVIVDEFSMCDVTLANDLFAALKPGKHQVVLVGDVDQLPSVGPGSVLRDLISCGQVPVTRLKFNYRQAGGSKIAEYANLLTSGLAPPTHSAGDYVYVAVKDDEEAAREVLQAVKQAMKAGLGPMDFQVLSPMRRGKAGVKALNTAIRDIINPEKKGTPKLGRFRLGDKVMVIKNDYSLGVFNGNLGVIAEVGKGQLTAEIDGANVTFRGDEELDLLTLAYAATIHKSQGSEFPLVIMPLLRHHYIMLQRNLLYTGMTRARDKLVLISDGFGVKRAAQNDKVEERYSLLAERIRGEGQSC